MKKNYLILILDLIFSMIFISCTNSKKLEIQKFILSYRNVKSSLWASTDIGYGNVSNKLKDKYWSREFTTVGSDNPKYIIIKNEPEITDIVASDFGKNMYEVQCIEYLLGEYAENSITMYEVPKEYKTQYIVSINRGKILCEYDWMYSNFYVLEKDASILLKRLNTK